MQLFSDLEIERLIGALCLHHCVLLAGKPAGRADGAGVEADLCSAQTPFAEDEASGLLALKLGSKNR